MDTKPKCNLGDLSGPAGNVYAIIGTVSLALRRVGLPDKAAEFRGRALASASYAAVLRLCEDYVEVVKDHG